MVEFKEELRENGNVVVNCRTEEQARNLIEWMNHPFLFKEGTRWDVNKERTCYNVHRAAYSDILWFQGLGDHVLSYEEALASTKNEAEVEYNKPQEPSDGTTFTNYDSDTGVITEIKIPMDADLQVMAYQFKKFLEVQGYFGITEVIIKDIDSETSSEELYGC